MSRAFAHLGPDDARQAIERQRARADEATQLFSHRPDEQEPELKPQLVAAMTMTTGVLPTLSAADWRRLNQHCDALQPCRHERFLSEFVASMIVQLSETPNADISAAVTRALRDATVAATLLKVH
jgi:hypothetical protein